LAEYHSNVVFVVQCEANYLQRKPHIHALLSRHEVCERASISQPDNLFSVAQFPLEDVDSLPRER
jgi:hypothetical protein